MNTYFFKKKKSAGNRKYKQIAKVQRGQAGTVIQQRNK